MIFNVKNDFKISKKGGLLARGHVDATWNSRPRGSAMRAHAAPTRPGCDIYIIYLYTWGYSTYKHSVIGI